MSDWLLSPTEAKAFPLTDDEISWVQRQCPGTSVSVELCGSGDDREKVRNLLLPDGNEDMIGKFWKYRGEDGAIAKAAIWLIAPLMCVVTLPVVVVVTLVALVTIILYSPVAVIQVLLAKLLHR